MSHRPSLKANPDGWERAWQSELDRKYPSYRKRMPSMVSNLRSIGSIAMNDPSSRQSRAERFKQLCQLQADLTKMAGEKCVASEFEHKWKGCTPKDRKSHYVTAMTQVCEIPDMEHRRVWVHACWISTSLFLTVSCKPCTRGNAESLRSRRWSRLSRYSKKIASSPTIWWLRLPGKPSHRFYAWYWATFGYEQPTIYGPYRKYTKAVSVHHPNLVRTNCLKYAWNIALSRTAPCSLPWSFGTFYYHFMAKWKH